MVLDQAKGFVAGSRQQQLVAGRLQHEFEEPPHAVFIFDDQERGCLHGLVPGCEKSSDERGRDAVAYHYRPRRNSG